MKRLLCFVLAGALLLFGGCAKNTETPASEPEASVSSQAVAAPTNLTDVLDVIYKKVEMKGLSDIKDGDILYNLFHVDRAWVQDFAVRYSSGRYGVADVAILKPAEGRTEDIIDALEIRRSDRIAEFENYDVHDSLNIAKNAQIFERGDYIIFLMIADSDNVRSLINEQIPG